jgi:hypothetical protein
VSETTAKMRCCDDCGRDLTYIPYVIGVDYKIRCIPCHIKKFGERSAS